MTSAPAVQKGEHELPPGMLEYHVRTEIRDLIRLYGFPQARQIVAEILNDEADRRAHP
jgi:hypothetical protein